MGDLQQAIALQPTWHLTLAASPESLDPEANGTGGQSSRWDPERDPGHCPTADHQQAASYGAVEQYWASETINLQLLSIKQKCG